MPTSTVRISEKSQKLLKEFAVQDDKSMHEVLDNLLEQERRNRLFQQASAAYAALRNSTTAWQEELAERAAWDSTLMDGIDREEEWNEDGSVKSRD